MLFGDGLRRQTVNHQHLEDLDGPGIGATRLTKFAHGGLKNRVPALVLPDLSEMTFIIKLGGDGFVDQLSTTSPPPTMVEKVMRATNILLMVPDDWKHGQMVLSSSEQNADT